MKKKIIVPFVIIVVSIAILVFLSLPSPREPEAIPDPLNHELYLKLTNMGIKDAVVDITKERVLIRYNLLKSMNKSSVNYEIMRNAATIADSGKIVIQVYKDFKPLEEIVASREDVLAYMNGAISYKELEKRIETKSLK